MTLYISGKGGIDDSISQPSGSAYKELYAKQQKQLKVDKQRNQNDKLNKENKHWNVLSLDSYRTINDSEAENCRLGTRITPTIASNLFTFIIGIQNEHCYQSRTLFQFNNGARFALRKKQYRINEEHKAFLVEERERGNLDTLQFLDCIYRRIGD
jgi:hypothetical protein